MTGDPKVPPEAVADIVCAYLSNNNIPANDIAAVIATVHGALMTTVRGIAEAPQVEQRPAISIKKSVTPDAVFCLEDGKSFKSLKRHLMTQYGLTPAQYREKWGLPSDYPMVAPNYAASRSALARNMGLGRKPAVIAPAETPSSHPEKSSPPARRGRPRKVASA